jgi:large subunit ribosomal protein L33
LNAYEGDRPKRIPIALVCSVCHARNYKTTKTRQDGAQPLKLKKFCKTCDKHTIHEETR